MNLLQKRIIFTLFVSFFCNMYLIAKNPISIHSYHLNLALQDSAIDVKLMIQATKSGTSNPLYFLLNDCVKFSNASLNGKKFDYIQRNDTLFFSTIEDHLIFEFQYHISYCSKQECKRQITLCDSNQIIFERYYRWYPVLYDNFANYHAEISVPNDKIVFAYTPLDSISHKDQIDTYHFSLHEEDFPMIITRNIFHCEMIRKHDIDFHFYFIPNKKRLLTVENHNAIWATEQKQIDSLLHPLYQRAIDAVKWYNDHLWKKDIKNIHFIETTIDGAGFGLGNFILMDWEMINRDLFHKSLISHEISHIWMGCNLLYEATGKYFLGESIPEYINLLFYESWAGKPALNKVILQTKDTRSDRDSQPFTISFEELLEKRKQGNSLSLDAIYQKGPAFVHEFRKLIGTEKLLKIIRETYQQEKKFLSLEDFEESIKRNNCWDEYLKLYNIEL